MTYSCVVGPKGRNPEATLGEYQYAHIIDAGTTAIVDKGGGQLHTVNIGVVGTLAMFYDVAAGGTTDATTEIACVSIASLANQTIAIDIAFSKGLTVITSGAATLDITVSFRGAETTSPRTFGVPGNTP